MLAILDNPSLPKFLLRSGLAFVFAYAAISSLTSPSDWVGYMPSFLTERLGPGQMDLMLKTFSVFEIGLAVWLISGVHTFWAALATSAGIMGIILATPSQFIITFRDVGLLAASLSLAALAKPARKE